MPLRDHFRPPLDDTRSWEGFYGAWPAMIVIELNRRLPAHYAAGPRVLLGTSMDLREQAAPPARGGRRDRQPR